MGVGYESQVFASCDMCHADEFSSTRTLADFKDMLRREGWSIGRETICPECNARRKAMRQSMEKMQRELNARRKAKNGRKKV